VQAQLIDSTLEDLKLVDHGVGNQDKTYYPPCKHNSKMNQDEGGKEHDCSWGSKSVIGSLTYLEKFTIGNMAISSVYPCSWYLLQPRRIYDEAATELEGICWEPRIRALLCGCIHNSHLITMLMQTLVVTGILCIQQILTWQKAEWGM
jgi:hypothetical protein